MGFEAPEVEISSNGGDPSDIRNITGVVSLPTGAATAARQDSQSTLLTNIDNKTPNLVSGSQPVVTRNGSGVETGTAAQPYRVDPTGTTTQPVSSLQLPSALSNGALPVEIRLPETYLRSSFGALRIASAENVLESLFSFDKQPLIWDEVITTGGTSTFNANTRSVDMSTNLLNGASVIRQTFRRARYNPSRTVQFIAAGTFGAGVTNCRKRLGQFDDQDGLFFEQEGSTVYVVRRSSTSGAVVDDKIAQSSWNVDKLDGTGPSGITIDFTKHQAFYIQYAFQGFGQIGFGFYLNGTFLLCHKITTGNALSTPFMRNPHLPARAEITNIGTTLQTATFSYNSVTIKNENEDSGIEGSLRSYSAAPVKVVTTTNTPVISIRQGSSFIRGVMDLVAANVFVNTADEVIWSIYLNPTLVGATYAVTSGYAEIDTAALTMTGGTEVISGILSQTQSSTVVSQVFLRIVNEQFGASINGTSQVLTLAARSRVGSADVLSGIIWREYP